MSIQMNESTVDAFIGDEGGPRITVTYDRHEQLSEIAAVGPSGAGIGVNLGPDEVADLIEALNAMLIRMRLREHTPEIEEPDLPAGFTASPDLPVFLKRRITPSQVGGADLISAKVATVDTTEFSEWAVEFDGGTAFVSDDRADVEDWVQWIVGGVLVRRDVTQSEWYPASRTLDGEER